MSNLVPQLAQKKIAKEYWVRVITAWFVLWSVAFLIAAILIYPLYVFTATQVDVQAASATDAQSLVEDFAAVTDQIERANFQARLVIEDSRTVRASDYVAFFDSFESATVSITGIEFTRQGNEPGPIRLTGVAADRESLAGLRDQLLATEVVDTVDLPISNLAQDRNLNFTITVVTNPGVDL